MGLMNGHKPGLTRRQLAASALVLTPVAAQDPAKPAAPEDLLAPAREQSARTSAALRKFDLSQLVEPSFTFKP
jgi:hypothetical protein